MLCSKVNSENPKLPELDINQAIEDMTSYEFVDNKIKKILGE